VLRRDAVAAAVSAAPEPLVGRRRELLAHSAAVESLWAAGPVLPLRFGTVVPDEDTLVGEVLSDPDGLHAQRLEQLRGRAEVSVKVWHDEDVVLREIVAEDREIATLQARIRRGGSYADRIRLGELVAGAVARKAEADGRRLFAEFAPLALDAQPGALVDGTILNVGFLVETPRVKAFVAAVNEQVDSDERLSLRVAGPLPPYSFADAGGSTESVEAGNRGSEARRRRDEDRARRSADRADSRRVGAGPRRGRS
jgi:hypothetical protein